MIALICAVVMLLAGASPAAAADGRLWSQAWSWLVSIWGNDDVGLEIDPNGNHSHVLTPPPPPPPTTTNTTSSTGTARVKSPALPGRNGLVENQPGSWR
jgi:hypothetical protein